MFVALVFCEAIELYSHFPIRHCGMPLKINHRDNFTSHVMICWSFPRCSHGVKERMVNWDITID